MPLGAPKNVYNDGPANTALVTTAETVVVTVAGVDATQEGDQVIVEGLVVVTPGTGTTGLTVRCRRTGLAGAQVGANVTVAAVAGNAQAIAFQAQDVPGESAGGQYVLTVQQAAATANGNVTVANIQATY